MTTPARLPDTPAPTLAPAPQATGAQVAAAVLLAGAQVALAVAFAILAFAVVGPGAGVPVSLALAFALVLDLGAWLRTGQGLAWRIAGVTLLARTDDAPLGLARLVPLPPTWAAETRGRRHPVDVRLEPLVLADPAPLRGPRSASAAPQVTAASAGQEPGANAAPPGQPAGTAGGSRRARAAARAQGADAPALPVLPPGMRPLESQEAPRPHAGPVRVTVDGQARHMLAGTALVGRRPTAAREGQSVITVTDLTRTLSKNHLRLEVDEDGVVVVTDLGSTNGSAIVGADGYREELVPHVAVEISLHDTVTLGDHRLTFSQGGGA